MSRGEPQELLNWSISSFQAWQQCEQRYDYQYRRRLKAAQRGVALELGSLFHNYLETYYQALKDDRQPATAHDMGLEALKRHDSKLYVMAATAKYAGDDALADQYQDMPRVLATIANRYFIVRGQHDANQYVVLVVEQKLKTLLIAGVNTDSRIDLVLRDRGTGLTYLVEHKTTGNIPSNAFRIRDLQTTLYARMLERFSVHIDYILWNYIRTKTPTVPRLLVAKKKGEENGGLSKAKDIDTTWEVYRQAIVDNNLDLEDYTDMHDLLKDREQNVFFPRYSHPVMVDQEKLLYDYAVEAQRANVARKQWDLGLSIPVRTLSRGCDWCEYFKICEAVLMGGDEESIINLRYIGPKEQDAAQQPAIS